MGDTFWAVVPAGGAGTRLWPLSRAATPKFLQDLSGAGRSMLQTTVDRLAPVAGDRIIVVTGQAHLAAVTEQLPDIDPAAILAEPSPRDSMAAIGLAAALLERRAPDAVMGAFAADHVITDDETFLACVRLAAEVARDDWLVTIGVAPTHPATGFGYIHLGDEMRDHQGVHVARAFVEKPSAENAAGYLATGSYRWNAGIFVVRPRVLLDLLGESAPEFAAALRGIAAAPDSLAEVWPSLPRIAIDHAVAEPAAAAGRVAVVPGAFGWDDIGDFASLAALQGTADRLHVLGDPAQVHAVDSTGLVVARSNRTIAVIGIDGVVVVDSGDALLVTTTARAQDVKAVVAELRESDPGLT